MCGCGNVYVTNRILNGNTQKPRKKNAVIAADFHPEQDLTDRRKITYEK